MAKCYYDNEHCNLEDGLWQCLTCREWFCCNHGHSTSKGVDVECVSCERIRQEVAVVEREFLAGTPARCIRGCPGTYPLPKVVRAVRENSKCWRVMDFATLGCGHMDCHWVFDADVEAVDASDRS